MHAKVMIGKPVIAGTTLGENIMSKSNKASIHPLGEITPHYLKSNADPLLSRSEAAQYLGVSEQTLAVWASTNRYPLHFFKIGRLVKYKKSDLDLFINSGQSSTKPA